MRFKFTDKFDSFYFIGIGGVSMSGLAKYLLSLGKKVGGSDASPNAYTEELAAAGAIINEGALNDYDLIVYTDAIKETDLRLCEAQKLGKQIISRGQLLYEISRDFETVVAVAGCHGKTTCTAMLAHIFSAAEKEFAVHIGGNDLTFSNFYYRGNEFFITEACEYKKNFLLLEPDIAVILNSEPDHIECYGSEAALKQAYIDFADRAEAVVSLYCDLPIKNSVSFGFDKSARYYAKNIRVCGDDLTFVACEGETELGVVKLKVHGKHNVLNALAAIAAARGAGIGFDAINKGLGEFIGVERRFEKIGEVNGAVCIADYAHHPNELRAVIRTAKKLSSGKVFVVFQPHTYSRTKSLFKEFVKVLSPLNNLLIYKTFAAREYFDDAGSALTLSQSIKKSRYGDDVKDLTAFISGAEEGDTVLFLGAGDIYNIAKKAVELLQD